MLLVPALALADRALAAAPDQAQVDNSEPSAPIAKSRPASEGQGPSDDSYLAASRSRSGGGANPSAGNNNNNDDEQADERDDYNDYGA